MEALDTARISDDTFDDFLASENLLMACEADEIEELIADQDRATEKEASMLEGIDGTDELNIQHAILQLMRDRSTWTNAELKSRLAKLLPLTEQDRKVGERQCESVWANRVNNALSPSRKSSLYRKGHVENVEHGHHRITGKGLAFINEDEIDLDDLLNDVLNRSA